VVELGHLEDRVLGRDGEVANRRERAADAERLALHDRQRRRARFLDGGIKRERHLGDRMAQVERRRFLAVELRRLAALAEIRAVAAQPDQLDLGPDVAHHARDLLPISLVIRLPSPAD